MRTGIARLHSDGTLDTAFDPNPDGFVTCRSYSQTAKSCWP